MESQGKCDAMAIYMSPDFGEIFGPNIPGARTADIVAGVLSADDRLKCCSECLSGSGFFMDLVVLEDARDLSRELDTTGQIDEIFLAVIPSVSAPERLVIRHWVAVHDLAAT